MVHFRCRHDFTKKTFSVEGGFCRCFHRKGATKFEFPERINTLKLLSTIISRQRTFLRKVVLEFSYIARDSDLFAIFGHERIIITTSGHQPQLIVLFRGLNSFVTLHGVFSEQMILTRFFSVFPAPVKPPLMY